jgi:hypothetical protein
MDIPQNYIFVCLKDHKGNIIVWIVIIFWDIRIKILLTLKIMDFENVILIKVVHIYLIKGMNA